MEVAALKKMCCRGAELLQRERFRSAMELCEVAEQAPIANPLRRKENVVLGGRAKKPTRKKFVMLRQARATRRILR